MGTYNVPRNLKGESRILYIFTVKGLITTAIGGAIGALFYAIFASLGLSNVGFVILGIFAAVGFVIGTVKIPAISSLQFTKKLAGDSLDDIILKYVKFKRNRKIYVYTKEEK